MRSRANPGPGAAYACGGFVKTAVIPADRASWGAIQILDKQNQEFLRAVLEKDMTEPAGDPVATKIGDYFAACIDERATRIAGIEGGIRLQHVVEQAARLRAHRAAERADDAGGHRVLESVGTADRDGDLTDRDACRITEPAPCEVRCRDF